MKISSLVCQNDPTLVPDFYVKGEKVRLRSVRGSENSAYAISTTQSLHFQHSP